MLRHSKDNRTPPRKPTTTRHSVRVKSVRPDAVPLQEKRASARPPPAPILSMPAPPALPSRSNVVSPPKPRTATRPPAAASIELITAVHEAPVRESPREAPARELPVREAPKTKVVVTATTKTGLLSHEANATERETLLGPVGKSIMPEVPAVLVASQRPAGGAIEAPKRVEPSSGLPRLPNVPSTFSSTAAPPEEPSPRGQFDSLSNERTHFNVVDAPAGLASAHAGSREADDSLSRHATSPVVRLPLSRRLRSHPLVWFVAGCAFTLLLVTITEGSSTEPNTALAAPAHSTPVAVAAAEPVRSSAPRHALAASSPPETKEPEVGVSASATEATVVEVREVAKAEAREPESPRPRAPKVRAYKARSSKGNTQRKKSFVPSGL
jgi:hypothetical protein